MLSKVIQYYPVRSAVRPGITGWAQVRYKYGNTVEDSKEKLQYDLYYIKNASLGLDLMIMSRRSRSCCLGGARNEMALLGVGCGHCLYLFRVSGVAVGAYALPCASSACCALQAFRINCDGRAQRSGRA